MVVGLMILLGGCYFVIVLSQPCSWLDLALSYTGCIRKLNVGASFNGVFSRDLTMFGSGTTSGGIDIWQTTDGRLLHTTSGSKGIFSSDDAFFITNSIYQLDTLSVWSTQDWSSQTTLETDLRMITDFAMAPDMSSLAVAGSSSRNGLIQVWQTSNRTLLHKLEGHTHYVLSVAYSPDGALLASGGRDKIIRLWQVEDGRLLHTLQATSNVKKVVFAPDGLTLASATVDGTIHLWRTDDGILLHTLKGHNADVRDIAYSPDGLLLASADFYGVVQLWNVNRGSRIRTLRQNWVLIATYALAFSPDGKILATAQRYGPLWFYDIQQLLGKSAN